MSTVRRNIVWLLASQATTWLVSIVLLVAVPRELGETDFGELTFAFMYVAFFQLIATFGTSEYLTKTIARDRSTVGRYVWNSVLLKAFVSLALGGVALGIGVVLGFDSQRMALVAVYVLGMVLNVLNNALMGGLHGLQRMGRAALYEVIRAYAGAGLGLVVLFGGGSVVGYALMFNVVGVIPLVGNALDLKSDVRDSRRVDFTVWREVIVGGSPFFVLSALTIIYGTIDIPMIDAFTDSETVGWYGLAYRWVGMPAFIAAAVATATFPALSAEAVTLTEAFTRMANRAIQLVIFVSLPCAIGMVLVADDFIEMLYGSDFAGAAPLMQLLALHIPIVGLDIILGVVVVAADRQRRWVVYSVIAAIFNPLMNLLAIPLADRWFQNGAIGAAFTTVLTEFILMIGGLRLRPHGVLDRPTGLVVRRVAIASGAIIPAVLLVHGTPVYVQILVGIAAYGTASLLLRTIPIEDIRGLLSRQRDPVADHVDASA